MSEYIQIGTTALRDPATGDFLPSVPLFIRAEDREKCQPKVLIDGDAFEKKMLEKFAEYKKADRKEQKRRKKEIEDARRDQEDRIRSAIIERLLQECEV